MLFASLFFLLCFLPLCLLGQRLTLALAPQRLPLFLLAASLCWYARLGWAVLLGMLAYVLLGWALGLLLATRPRRSRLVWTVALALLPLFVLRYLPWLTEELIALASLCGLALPVLWSPAAGEMPPGLPFVTLVMVAWLVDIFRGQARPGGPLGHALFGLFFPCVMAGPLLRAGQWQSALAQLPSMSSDPDAASRSGLMAAQGLTLLIMGLAKSVIMADALDQVAGPLFQAAAQGWPLHPAEAWLGSVARSLHIYFSFSGYADMALGAGLLLGLRLPDNFDSPYKATGFVDFWRRWHMTLAAWLRDFLYLPLGGGTHGRARQYAALVLSMSLVGLWHGAGWGFLLWGMLHGLLLCINQGFRRLVHGTSLQAALNLPPLRALCVVLTFLLLNVSWVLFFADSLPVAWHYLSGMLGLHGTTGAASSVWPDMLLPHAYVSGWAALLAPLAGLLLVWALPNSRELVLGHRDGSFPCGAPALDDARRRLNRRLWILWLVLLTNISLLLLPGRTALPWLW